MIFAPILDPAIKAYNARQPRDDHGKWSDGAGGISAGHAAHVMRSEGVSDEKAAAVLGKIKDGTHKSREDVLKHIDSIHAGTDGGAFQYSSQIAAELHPKMDELHAAMQGSKYTHDKAKIQELTIKQPELERGKFLDASIAQINRSKVIGAIRAIETPSDFSPVFRSLEEKARAANPRDRSGFYSPSHDARADKAVRLEPLKEMARVGLPNSPGNEMQLREHLDEVFHLGSEYASSRKLGVSEIKEAFPQLQVSGVAAKKVREMVIDKILRRSPAQKSDDEIKSGRALSGPDESPMFDDTLIAFGEGIKAVEETDDSYKFGAFLVVFDSPDISNYRDSFTKSTDFGFEDGDTRPILYNHGLDGTFGKTTIGKARLYLKDAGVWMEGEVKKRKDYLEKHIERVGEGLRATVRHRGIDAPMFGASSGSAAHSVVRETKGAGHEIKQWFLAEASITPSPAEPQTVCMSLKSLVEIEAAESEADEFKTENPKWNESDHPRANDGKFGSGSREAAVRYSAQFKKPVPPEKTDSEKHDDMAKLLHKKAARYESLSEESYDEAKDYAKQGSRHMSELSRAEGEVLSNQAAAMEVAARRHEEAAKTSTPFTGGFFDAHANFHKSFDEADEMKAARGWQTQPRDDGGKWTDGAGNLSASHVSTVMHSEGISHGGIHQSVKEAIESGRLKTRAQVLAVIDELHSTHPNKAGVGATSPESSDLSTNLSIHKHGEKPLSSGKLGENEAWERSGDYGAGGQGAAAFSRAQSTGLIKTQGDLEKFGNKFRDSLPANHAESGTTAQVQAEKRASEIAFAHMSTTAPDKGASAAGEKVTPTLKEEANALAMRTLAAEREIDGFVSSAHEAIGAAHRTAAAANENQKDTMARVNKVKKDVQKKIDAKQIEVNAHRQKHIAAQFAYIQSIGGFSKSLDDLETETDADADADADEIKSGRALSGANHARLSELSANLQDAAAALETFLSEHDDDTDDGPEEETISGTNNYQFEMGRYVTSQLAKSGLN